MRARTDEAEIPSFELDGNVLTVNVELYWENHAEFMQYSERLLEKDAARFILDLSGVTFIFSAYMGSIGRMLHNCGDKGKHLTIRINKNLCWLFEMVGLSKIIDIEVVN